MNLGVIIKIGAICSFVGICLFAILIALLLVFPVIKQCVPSTKCTYSSTAPEPFLLLINPGYACISLSCIATGVLMFRLGIFYKARKK
ncbi:MAG: hypothetical protein WCA39_03515 [Nitrososphaeraceae archaeon]